MYVMIGRRIATIDEWRLTFDCFHARVVVRKRREIRVGLPKLRASRPHANLELSGVTTVQVADDRRYHKDVARREIRPEDEFFHSTATALSGRPESHRWPERVEQVQTLVRLSKLGRDETELAASDEAHRRVREKVTVPFFNLPTARLRVVARLLARATRRNIPLGLWVEGDGLGLSSLLGARLRFAGLGLNPGLTRWLAGWETIRAFMVWEPL